MPKPNQHVPHFARFCMFGLPCTETHPRPCHFQRTLTLIFVCALTGCGAKSCETEGLEQLTEDTPRYVAFPGHRLGTVGDDETPIQLLGRQGIPHAVLTRDRNSILRIVPFDDGRTCSVGPTISQNDKFGRSVYPALDDYVAFHVRRDDANTALSIVDRSCRRRFGPYANALLVGQPAAFEPEQFVIHTASGDLVSVRPYDRTETILARNVTKVALASPYLYALENGRVTLRSRTLSKIATFGDAVTEIVASSVVGKAAFIDKRGLFYITPENGKENFVDSAACRAAWADADADLVAIQYQRSCDDPSLLVKVRTKKAPFVLPKDAEPPVSVRVMERDRGASDLAVSYFVAPAPDETNTSTTTDANAELKIRYIGPWGSPGEAVGRAYTSHTISESVKDKLLLFVEPDNGHGRLVEWSFNKSREYLSNVVLYTDATLPARAVVRGASKSELLQVEAGRRPTLLVDGADDLGKKFGANLLVTSDKHHDLGQVHYLTNSRAPELLFENAYEPSTQVLWQGVAASGLLDYSLKSFSGNLCVRMIVTADTFCESHVRSYVQTIRPARGIAYVSVRDKTPTLYWAQAR